jgi:type II secretory pathway pseudopilin PulG
VRVCRAGGFALIALLVVIFLMGLGLSAAADVWRTTMQREREKDLLFVGVQFRDALRSYAALGQGPERYPLTLEQLLQDDRSPTLRRHLRRIYPDPLTGKTEWGLVRRAGRIVGVYSLARGNPLRRTGFNPDLVEFASASTYSDWRFLAEATAKDAGRTPSAPAQPAPPAPLVPEPLGEPLKDASQVEPPSWASPCEKEMDATLKWCWSTRGESEQAQCQDDAQRQAWKCEADRARAQSR